MDKLSIAIITEISPMLKDYMERAKLTEWETKAFYYIMFEQLTAVQIEMRELMPYTARHIKRLYAKARRKINKILP